MDRRPAGRCAVHHHDSSGGNPRRPRRLPEGRRRVALETAAQAIFADDFSGRVLPFDTAAAAVYPDFLAARRRAGRPTAPLDLMIAAIARANGAGVVTRDIGGFAD